MAENQENQEQVEIEEVVWDKVEEDGKRFWCSDLGNIIQLEDQTYMVMMPRILRVGNFKTLQDAKNIMQDKKIIKKFSEMLQEFNKEVMKEIEW